MKNENQDGYTLIELLLVVAIVMTVASMAISWYFKAIQTAENQSAVTVMSLIRQNQVIFYGQKQRFARLDEIAANQTQFGRIGDDLILRRGPYKFELTTSTGAPTSSDLRNLSSEYLVTATREHSSAVPYVYTMDQSGVITQVLPEAGTPGN